MKFINLTSHAIAIRLVDGSTLVIPADGTVARVAVQAVPTAPVAGIPTVVNGYGEVEGLRPANTYPADVVILVSAMVLSRLGSEYAGLVYAPDTGETAIRNRAGQIEAVTRLVGVADA